MKSSVLPVLLSLTLAGLCGCQTLVNERRARMVREQTEVQNLKVQIQRLQERVDGLVTAQQDIYREIESLRAAFQGDKQGLRGDVDKAIRSLDAVEARQQKLKDEIIAELSRKVAELVQKQNAAAPVSRAEEGYEHTVQPGQTLSQIAAAYKVSTAAIVKANNLKDPNSLRAGQKLFIPE